MHKMCLQSKHENTIDGGSAMHDHSGMKIFAQRLTDLVQEHMDQGTPEAEICRDVGIKLRRLGMWKQRGTVARNERELWLLCRRLGTHPNYLLGWSNERAPREPPPMAADLDAQIRENKRKAARRG